MIRNKDRKNLFTPAKDTNTTNIIQKLTNQKKLHGNKTHTHTQLGHHSILCVPAKVSRSLAQHYAKALDACSAYYYKVEEKITEKQSVPLFKKSLISIIICEVTFVILYTQTHMY